LAATQRAASAILEVYDTEFAVEQKDDRSPLTLADRRSSEIIEDALRPTGLPILGEEGKHTAYEQRRAWQRFWLVDPLDGTKEFIKRNGEFTVNIALVENGLSQGGVVLVPVSGVLYFALAGEGAYRASTTSGMQASEVTWDSLVAVPAVRLPLGRAAPRPFTVVASRSHLSAETATYVDELRRTHGDIDVVSRGSSLKLCLIAEGSADTYPRFGPTMEWDTAAGHAVVKESGGNVYRVDSDTELQYNKPELLNPWFVARRPRQEPERR